MDLWLLVPSPRCRRQEQRESPSQPFRFLLCRRLHLPPPLVSPHLPMCASSTYLATRVSSNMFVRDMDLFQRAGWAQAGDRGERSDIVARGPVGHRYDDGVSPQGGMGRPGQELQTTTVPFWRWHAAGRKPPIPNSQERMVAHVWWSLPPRLAGAGTVRRHSSSQRWPMHHWCCKAAPRLLGERRSPTPPGLHTTTRELQTCTFDGSRRFQTVEYTFIQTRFHPTTLSSKTLSSNNNFTNEFLIQ